MKTLVTQLSLLALVATGSALEAQALPVLNLNAAGAQAVTIYPDHQDKNLYYTAPQVMLVAKDDAGAPLFSFLEYKEGFFYKTRAIVQLTLRPQFSQKMMNEAMEGVLKHNPNAKFTGIPFVKSNLIFSTSLKPLIEEQECTHQAGILGDEQVCNFRLNPQGRAVLLPMFLSPLGLTVQLGYEIMGAVQQADGSYKDQALTFQMGGRIGGTEFRDFPGNFRDRHGDPLELPEPVRATTGD